MVKTLEIGQSAAKFLFIFRNAVHRLNVGGASKKKKKRSPKI